MGCWSGTDSITGLPINHGDKCRVFLITKQNYADVADDGGGYCSSHDVWYPRGFGVLGEYDDYGGLEKIEENLHTDILLNGLKKDVVPYKAKNEWDKDFSPKNIRNIGQIINRAERNKVKVYDGESTYETAKLYASIDAHKRNEPEPNMPPPTEDDRPQKTLGVMFVLEDIYQTILSYDPLGSHHSKDGFLYRKRSEILNDNMDEWYNNGLENYREWNKKFKGKINFISAGMTSCGWHNMFNTTHADPPFCKGISYYFDFLKEKMMQHVPYQDPEVQFVAQGLIDFYKFQYALSETRKGWQPQYGKGSQQNETEIYAMLAHTMLNVHEKAELKRLEYRGDNDYREEHNKNELARRASKGK